jgi:hypothetical protein
MPKRRRVRVTVGAVIALVLVGVIALLAAGHKAPAPLPGRPSAPPQTFSGPPRQYFVDCSRLGSGDGSAAAPWNSLTAANRASLTPGSSLLLRRGSTCRGYLAPRGSGLPARPIVIGAYGQGALPRIDTGGAYPDSVALADESYIVLQDLELTNRGDYLTPRRGVHVVAEHPGAAHDIELHQLYVHDVQGADNKDLGGSGGIQVDAATANVVILDNRVTSVNRSGIWVAGTGLPPRPANGQRWPSATTGVLISRNTVLGVGGDGIVPTGTVGAVVSDNVVCCGNVRGRRPVQFDAGIWTFNSNGTVIERNDVYGMRNAKADGTGYDVDYDQDGTIVQDNYGHDNAGGFILLCTDNEHRTADVRFNLSTRELVFDQTACGINQGRGGTLDGVRVYNNTFVTPTSLIRQNSAAATAVLHEAGSFQFVDNIVYATARQSRAFPCGHHCKANLFWNLPPSGSRHLTANPLFVGGSPRGEDRMQAALPFRLRPDSAAIRAGVPVSGNATADYFGDPLTSPPSIGFDQPR